MVAHRVLALVSGGKDSCYSMLECVAAGHTVVALANLRPHDETENELDSYMYQTVGHQVIHLYAEAVGLPLHRGTIKRDRSINTDLSYETTIDDEVEDLYRLLKNLLDPLEGYGPDYFTAVCSGAILSDYQRIRVEHVCARLGLVSLAYLWRRDQSELLDQMVRHQMDSVLIKTATLGLDQRHLGQSLAQVRDHLHAMNKKFGINVCGEGGEYETLTLNCPLFKKKVVLEETETDVQDDVSFLKIKSARLEDKQLPKYASQLEMLKGHVSDVDSILPITSCKEVLEESDEGNNFTVDSPDLVLIKSDHAQPKVKTCDRFYAVNNLTSDLTDPKKATVQIFDRLMERLSAIGGKIKDLVSVNLTVSSMADYGTVNAEYVRRFGVNPPVRVCVQGAMANKLSMSVIAAVEATDRHTMHVQGISHWAPANIGPYSQAVRANGVLFTAGQIGMVPGTLDLVSGLGNQARLSMRSLKRVLDVYGKAVTDARAAVCYATSPDVKKTVLQVWESEFDGVAQPLAIAVVPGLPKGASVEWHLILNSPAEDVQDEVTESFVIGNDGDNKVSTVLTTCGRTFFTAIFEGSALDLDLMGEWIERLRASLAKMNADATVNGQMFVPATDLTDKQTAVQESLLSNDINLALVPVCDLATSCTNNASAVIMGFA